MPLVATPPSATAKVCRASPVTGRDADRARLAARDPHVARAGDDDAGAAGEVRGDAVGEQALGEPPAVERDAGRALDGAVAHADRAPGRGGCCAGRPAVRGEPQQERHGQRRAGRGAVAGGGDLARERAVDEAAGPRARLGHGRGERHELGLGRHDGDAGRR